MNPNTLELITNELAELNQIRLFKSKMVEKLFGDLNIPNYKPDDEDIFSCVQGLKNLSTGWDEDDGCSLTLYHHPSYNQLKERVSKLSTGLVGGGIIPLAKKSDELRLKVDALEKTIVEKEEDIQQYKDTLDDHLHHYDLLKKKNEKLETHLSESEHELYILKRDAKGYGEEEVNEYREEIKKLQERAEKFRVRLCNRNEELVKALSPWKKNYEDHKRVLEAIAELKQENKNLKEEIKKLKKLKEENQDLKLRAPMPLEYYDDAIGNLEKEIADLKDEHEVTLHDIREYLGRFGGDEVEVFDKIVDENATIKKVQ